jgi:hypothetical protein
MEKKLFSAKIHRFLNVKFVAGMTIPEFNKLDIKQKTDAVWEWGFFLCRSGSMDNIRTLFLLDNFFVEILFDERNAVKEIRAFSADELNNSYAKFLNGHTDPLVRAVVSAMHKAEGNKAA